MKTYNKGDRVAGKCDGQTYVGTVMAFKNEDGLPTYAIETDSGEMLVLVVTKENCTIRKSRKKKLTQEEQDLASATHVEDEILVDVLLRYDAALLEAAELKKQHAAKIEESKEILWKAKEIMDEQKLKNCKYTKEDGSDRLCYRMVKKSPTVAEKDQFEAWCEGAGVDRAQFTMPSPGKFKAWYNEREKTEMGLPLGVEVFEEEKLSFRNA